jgi:hypothetical protein
MLWMLFEDFCGSLIDSLETGVEKICNKFVKKTNEKVDELILGKVVEKEKTEPMSPAVVV